MIKTSIEQLSESIGRDIGRSDNVTQANLLNGFCEGLHDSILNDRMGLQLSYITDGLSNKTMKVLIELSEFIKLKNNE